MKILESKCPRYSEKDAAEITARLKDGSLFPGAEPDRRAELLEHLSKLPTLITSLHTFANDVHFMGEVVPCIYHIVDKNLKLSCSRILREAYTKSSGFEVAERKLWILTLTSFLALAAPAARSERYLLAKQRPGEPMADVLHMYATEAHHLGFTSSKISRLLAVRPEAAVAKQALLSVRRPHAYHVEDHHIKSIQDAMSEICEDITETPREPPASMALASGGEKPRYLSGFPDVLSFRRDKEELHHLYSSTEPVRDADITSLFRLQSFCHSFFRVSEEVAGTSTLNKQADGARTVGRQGLPDNAPPSFEQTEYHGGENREEAAAHWQSAQDHPFAMFFMTLENGQWQVLRRVHPATVRSVENTARELCSYNYSLLAVTKDCRTGGIAPGDCFDSAAASGINTVLAVPHDNSSSFVSYHCRALYAQ